VETQQRLDEKSEKTLRSSAEKATSIQTEPSTSDRLTTHRLSAPIHFQLLPSGTRIAGPVVILQKTVTTLAGPKAMVLLSNKLIFPDGSEVVVGVETRALWQGHDGAAFDASPTSFWKIAAAQRAGIISAHGSFPL
jgi:hypothetical protein